ncbi:LrgB family protein [Propionivibrio dicarboxylicus]|uniref:TIGR00659 family protein n=1 Tax=Propionivibrio dicarboxylicus TaxID=83767 RepID=A0A1G7ZCA2_9RHOO|nr:LrgB family protein [Propionivibrio dicarboxylicus]SDH06166.1 TIGR00659 family protein [Propionivibrio dicarboxylicus]
MKALLDLWSYLLASPLLGLTATLLAYQAGVVLFKRTGQQAWANPVLIAIILIGLFLWFSGVPYERYFDSARIIHFLLGPATVALAVPLFTQWRNLKRMAMPLIVGLFAGSAAAAFSAMAIASWLGASPETVRSLAPKSVTTPIAMGVAEKIGGLPSLTAVLVVLTGILGAACFPTLFRLLGIKRHATQGFAVGLAAHGLGTARAFMVSEEMGAFAALAMGLNGIVTALLLPLLLH